MTRTDLALALLAATPVAWAIVIVVLYRKRDR